MSFFAVMLVAILCAAAPATAAADIAGRVSVIDGDTIEICGNRIRLIGIDAPESNQTCQDADGRANAAARWLRTRSTQCSLVRRSVASRVTLIVSGVPSPYAPPVGQTWRMSAGLELDDARYSGGASKASQAATERQGIGIWRGPNCGATALPGVPAIGRAASGLLDGRQSQLCGDCHLQPAQIFRRNAKPVYDLPILELAGFEITGPLGRN